MFFNNLLNAIIFLFKVISITILFFINLIIKLFLSNKIIAIIILFYIILKLIKYKKLN